MSLGNLFGDDEHTASEGPYQRVMKTRKWIYITGSLGLLIAGGRYHEDGGYKLLLGVFSVPEYVFAFTIITGLFYLLPIYTILVTQLRDVYSAVLDERLADQKFERLKETAKRHVKASEELSNWVSSWNRLNRKKFIDAESSALKKMNKANFVAQKIITGKTPSNDDMRDIWPDITTRELTEFMLMTLNEQHIYLKNRAEKCTNDHNEAVKNRIDMEIQSPPDDDPEFLQLRNALSEATSDLSNPSNVQAYLSPKYRKKEFWVDILRISPPFITGTLAILAITFRFGADILEYIFGFTF